MINLDTVYLFEQIKDLAEDSFEYGYKAFSEINADTNWFPGIIYDDDEEEFRFSGEPDLKDTIYYRIIENKLVDEIHHDIISYYDSHCPDYRIYYVTSGEDSWIEIHFSEAIHGRDCPIITIRGGTWYTD